MNSLAELLPALNSGPGQSRRPVELSESDIAFALFLHQASGLSADSAGLPFQSSMNAVMLSEAAIASAALAGDGEKAASSLEAVRVGMALTDSPPTQGAPRLSGPGNGNPDRLTLHGQTRSFPVAGFLSRGLPGGDAPVGEPASLLPRSLDASIQTESHLQAQSDQGRRGFATLKAAGMSSRGAYEPSFQQLNELDERGPLGVANRNPAAAATVSKSAQQAVAKTVEATLTSAGENTTAREVLNWTGVSAAEGLSASSTNRLATQSLPEQAFISRQVGEQTLDRVIFMSRAGVEQARLQLHPAELGRVDIRLEIDGSDARLQLAVQGSNVREAIEAMLPKLRDALQQQGLDLREARLNDASEGHDGNHRNDPGDQGSGTDDGSSREGSMSVATGSSEQPGSGSGSDGKRLALWLDGSADRLLDAYA